METKQEIYAAPGSGSGAYGYGFGGMGVAPATEATLSNVRRDIADVKSDIRETVQNESMRKAAADLSLHNRICDVEHSIHDAHCDINKTALENRSLLEKSILENRVELLKVEGNFLRALDNETDQLKTQMNNFERSTDKEFCNVKGLIKDSTQSILGQLSADKLDEKNDIIAQLRAKSYHDEQSFLVKSLNYEIASVKNMVNSVDQNQRFNSKTVQFGAGNVAIPTQTANQG